MLKGKGGRIYILEISEHSVYFIDASEREKGVAEMGVKRQRKSPYA